MYTMGEKTHTQKQTIKNTEIHKLYNTHTHTHTHINSHTHTVTHTDINAHTYTVYTQMLCYKVI